MTTKKIMTTEKKELTFHEIRELGLKYNVPEMRVLEVVYRTCDMLVSALVAIEKLLIKSIKSINFEVVPLTAEEAREVSEEFKRGEHYSI